MAKKPKSENTPPKKAPSTAWKPGESGNPGGRPKGWADMKAEAQKHTAEAMKTLVGIMRGGKNIAAATRVRAAEVLLERGWGKPAQTVNLRKITSLGDLDDAELAALKQEAEQEERRGTTH